MSNNIIIGKYTLESLTSGMYSDPYVVFREYIQNSVDSIDNAVDSKVIKAGDDQIIVQLLPTENRILIKDNGMGIPCADAERTLISIGNSKKITGNSRGFRGIGRLSALSYCRKLIFTTSFPGENNATKIIIDASKLADLLSDTTEDDVSVMEVLQSVYTVETLTEEEDAHYFVVQMDGVDENAKLNNYKETTEYLSQNTPVPYSPEFVWGKEISNRLLKEGCDIKVYNVAVQYGAKVTPVYKPYKDEFLVDKGRNIFDCIQDIEIVKILYPDGDLSAIGWLAKTSYLGSIYDRAVKGIRLRKGNILIGDHQTLNIVFKDARFNGWSMGEFFAIDRQLIPNARRDNFEKNQAYFVLFEQLANISAAITREIRDVSLNRNAELSNVIGQVGSISKMTREALDTGVSSSKKNILIPKLKSTQEAVANLEINDMPDDSCQKIALEELDMLIGKLKGATSYKALNTIDKLTNTEKKILERVFNVICGMNIKNASEVIEAILNDFSNNI